ncbi:uncharacterized protein JCM6883_005568 [Sporobolomyces salmoneus]|uniref:uncharacterized protein n=1 Tax=Sporobolomyces salmoneus TaxID=183962 RepID=UPI0031705ADC
MSPGTDGPPRDPTGQPRPQQLDTSASETSSPSLPRLKGSQPTLAYILIRWLFRFVLGVFYSNVVVEGEEHIPPDGVPTMLCANHSNSLTDALLLVTSVPPSKRSLLRLTAKDTQFGRGTFSSFLIENAGTLPIKRPKDHLGQKVDNSIVFHDLIKSLEQNGDMICMFPEGMSRYHSEMSPLKQGVSRIVSDTLTRRVEAGDSSFKLAIQTVSMSYPQRNSFRSDVLITFNPPIYVSAQTHPDLVSTPSTTTTQDEEYSAHERAVRSLTSTIGTSIKSGILDAPSWSHLRAANTARRLYAPLGTKLTLGDHVRLTQRFVDALAGKRAEKKWDELEQQQVVDQIESGLKTPKRERGSKAKNGGEARLAGKNGKKLAAATEEVWKTPMREKGQDSNGGGGYFGIPKEIGKTTTTDGGFSAEEEEKKDGVTELVKDLKTYQDLLYLHGIKDDRVRNPRLLRRHVVLKRLLVRLAASMLLFAVALPGCFLWAPIFFVTRWQTKKMVKKGPAWDTYDEIAQTKLVYGVGSGFLVIALCVLFTLPFTPLNIFFFPLTMWLTLRFLEDLTSSLRALLALLRLLLLGKRQLLMLRSMRDDLRERVETLAVERAGLPRDAGVFVRSREKRWRAVGLGRLEEGVKEWIGFFDPRRRRKKDWNESLKMFDQTEFAEDEEGPPS